PQDCAGPDGCVFTVTLYVAPEAIGDGKLNSPLVAIARSSPPLFCRTRPVPARPLTVPRNANAPVAQVTAMFETLAAAIVPPALPIVHVCDGPEGCVRMVTLYAVALASWAVKVKVPLLGTARSFAPLSCSTRPAPSSPATVPLIVNPSWAGGLGGCSESTLPRPFEHAARIDRQHSK